MKDMKKISILAIAATMAFTSCSDMDEMLPEGGAACAATLPPGFWRAMALKPITLPAVSVSMMQLQMTKR